MAWGLRLARRKAAEQSAKAEPPAVEETTPVSTPAPQPTQPPPGAEPSSSAPRFAVANLSVLRQQLLDIYGKRIPRDEFAAQAVELIAKAMRLEAAALLAFDPRRDRLRLVASTGLSDQAQQALDGSSAGPSWDIPMRGLSNRRISVIESAHQNPFVPRPLIEVSPRRLTIASLPFFHGQAPCGVLVLLSGKRGFTDAQLQVLGQVSKVCAIAFVELRRPAPPEASGAGKAPVRVRDETHPSWEPAEARQRLEHAEELTRLRTAFDEALWQHAKEVAETRRAAAAAVDAERTRVISVESKLVEIEAERDRVVGQLAAIRGELATLADTRAALETSTREAERLQHVLNGATVELERSTAGLTELQRVHAEHIKRHEALIREHAEQNQGAAAEHEQDVATIRGLRGQIAALEADRLTLRATVEEIQTAHQQAAAGLETTRSRAKALQDQLDAVTVARETTEEQYKRVSAELKAWTEREPAWSSRIAETLARAEAAESERDRIAGALAELEREHGDGSKKTAERIRSLEEATHQLGKQRDDLASRHATSETARAALESERDRLDQLCNSLRTELEKTVAEREDAVAGREQQITTLHAQLAEAIARLESDAGKQTSRTRRIAQERDEASAALKNAEETLAKQHAKLNRLETELAEATEAQAEMRAGLEHSNAQRKQEVSELHRKLAVAEQQVATREKELAVLQGQVTELNLATDATRAAHSEELERFAGEWEAERGQLQARVEELGRELEHARAEHYALAEALSGDERQTALEIERCVIPGAEEEVEGYEEVEIEEPVAVEPGDGLDEMVSTTIAVIDGKAGADIVAAIGAAGWDALAYQPESVNLDELAAASLGGLAVNLANGSEAWEVVRSLRQHAVTGTLPLMLYARQPDGLAFSFGLADCVLWPSEPQRLLDSLARLSPRAKRVLAMSTDIDVVATVREQLTGAGLSVAVMLDGRQALELLPSVRPDAVVVHASASCADVFRTIAGLRAKSAGTAPLIVLLDATPTARDESFLNSGARTLANKGDVEAGGIVETLAQLVALRAGQQAAARLRAAVIPSGRAETIAANAAG